jgi:1,2-diacylglycerol 3-beta-galactosyltransferase
VSQGLPVITTHNAWTMPQERWNTEWVQQHGLGLVLRRFAEVDEAVPSLLAELPAYRERVRAQHNAAVFEVPQILERILREATSPPAPVAASCT